MFSHTLYLQSNRPHHWNKSLISIEEVMDINNELQGDRTRGMVLKNESLYQKKLVGYANNQDTWVDSITSKESKYIEI